MQTHLRSYKSRIARIIPVVLILLAVQASGLLAQTQPSMIYVKSATVFQSTTNVVEGEGTFFSATLRSFASSGWWSITQDSQTDDWTWQGLNAVYDPQTESFSYTPFIGVSSRLTDWLNPNVEPEIPYNTITTSSLGSYQIYRQVTNSSTWAYVGGTGTETERSSAEFELKVGNDADNDDTNQFVIINIAVAHAIDFVPRPDWPGRTFAVHSGIPLADLAINGLPVDGDGDVVMELPKDSVEPIVVTAANAPNKGVNVGAGWMTRVNLTYACHPNFTAPSAVTTKLQSVRSKLRDGSRVIFQNDYLGEIYSDNDPRVQFDPNLTPAQQRTNLYRLDDVPVKIEFILKPSWHQEPAQDPANPPTILIGRFPTSFTADDFYEVVSPTAVNALLAWSPAHVKEVLSIVYTDAAGLAQGYSGMADIGGFTFLVTPNITSDEICHEFGHACGLAHRGTRWVYELQPDGNGTFLREESEGVPDAPGMYYAYPNPGAEPHALMRAGGGATIRRKVNRYERGIILGSIGMWHLTGVAGPPL